MIYTSRLHLRPFSFEDEPVALPLLQSTDFMVGSAAGALNLIAAKDRFRALVDSHKSGGFGKFAIILRSVDELIGYCGIEFCEMDDFAGWELGFRIVKNRRGLGYATEAARAYLGWYDTNSDDQIIAFTERSNRPSINVLSKLKFQPFAESIFHKKPVILFGRSKDSSR